MLARRGAVAGLCPVTEASLGDGIFPAREFVAAGGRFVALVGPATPAPERGIAVTTLRVHSDGARLAAIAGRLTPRPGAVYRLADAAGASGDDFLRGTSGRDIIVAGGGNDVVLGRGGNDLVCLGAGGDLFRGGPGEDRGPGGPGADAMRGGAGNDVLVGSRGPDSLSGNRGPESCWISTHRTPDRATGAPAVSNRRTSAFTFSSRS